MYVSNTRISLHGDKDTYMHIGTVHQVSLAWGHIHARMSARPTRVSLRLQQTSRPIAALCQKQDAVALCIASCCCKQHANLGPYVHMDR